MNKLISAYSLTPIYKKLHASFVSKLTCRAGADGRIRTGDLILTKDALYLLSYISAVRFASNAGVIILQGG